LGHELGEALVTPAVFDGAPVGIKAMAIPEERIIWQP
jgi:hypothetical protein